METPVSPSDEATLLLAFERLCRSCKNLLPHPLYHTEIPIERDDGSRMVMRGIEEATDEGPMCKAGLRPLTRDGHDCPYFMRGAA